MGSIKHIITAFVLVIVGISLLGVIASEQTAYSEFSKAKNESITINKSGIDIWEATGFTLDNEPEIWMTYEGCNISDIVVTNSTDNTAWTLTTDYKINVSTGKISFVNTSITQLTADNLSYITYSYCNTGYLTESWGRSSLKLVSGFFAITLLLTGVGLFYNVAKETGIM